MTEKVNKKRLDQVLLDRGLCRSRNEARTLIMTHQVKVEGQLANKPGQAVRVDVPIDIAIENQNRFVSRGGLKLESALQALNISVADQSCLDIGASTGGFTDCLLQYGARQVYCVDVGKNQLHEKLKAHPQVQWKEQFHVKDLTSGSFAGVDLASEIAWVVIDISFISITKILDAVLAACGTSLNIIAMVKPQFELSPKDVPKGVVQDEEKQRVAVDKVIVFATSRGLRLKGEHASALKGPKGNQEYFVWFEKTSDGLIQHDELAPHV